MADQTLSITIKEPYVTRALDANDDLNGKTVTVIVSDDSGSGSSEYSVERGGSETNRQFARRMVKRVYFGLLKASEDRKGKADYREEVDEIPLPETDTPEEMIE